MGVQFHGYQSIDANTFAKKLQWVYFSTCVHSERKKKYKNKILTSVILSQQCIGQRDIARDCCLFNGRYSGNKYGNTVTRSPHPTSTPTPRNLDHPQSRPKWYNSAAVLIVK